MISPEILFRYFPDLSDKQQTQFVELGPCYAEWNAKINVISRKDIDQLYLHHVLHSLAIARFLTFREGAVILDLGTGGGFPGIPLAILYPDVSFMLIDSTQKKIKVVEGVATALGLDNVQAVAQRAEDHKGEYDFVVSRAVAPLSALIQWSARLIKKEPHIHALPNGLIALKGGDIRSEIRELPRHRAVETERIDTWFDDPWFTEKYVVWVQM